MTVVENVMVAAMQHTPIRPRPGRRSLEIVELRNGGR
jgi:hypothetical protein